MCNLVLQVSLEKEIDDLNGIVLSRYQHFGFDTDTKSRIAIPILFRYFSFIIFMINKIVVYLLSVFLQHGLFFILEFM